MGDSADGPHRLAPASRASGCSTLINLGLTPQALGCRLLCRLRLMLLLFVVGGIDRYELSGRRFLVTQPKPHESEGYRHRDRQHKTTEEQIADIAKFTEAGIGVRWRRLEDPEVQDEENKCWHDI